MVSGYFTFVTYVELSRAAAKVDLRSDQPGQRSAVPGVVTEPLLETWHPAVVGSSGALESHFSSLVLK